MMLQGSTVQWLLPVCLFLLSHTGHSIELNLGQGGGPGDDGDEMMDYDMEGLDPSQYIDLNLDDYRNNMDGRGGGAQGGVDSYRNNAQVERIPDQDDFYELSFREARTGKVVSMERYEGYYTIITNSARSCGESIRVLCRTLQ